MIKKIKPERHPNILKKIKECIEEGKYILTKHALDRQKERSVNLATTLYVLKNGYEEKSKTFFDKEHNTYKYAIRGITLNDEDIRIIIALDENGILIITVMYVGKL